MSKHFVDSTVPPPRPVEGASVARAPQSRSITDSNLQDGPFNGGWVTDRRERRYREWGINLTKMIRRRDAAMAVSAVADTSADPASGIHHQPEAIPGRTPQPALERDIERAAVAHA